MDVNDHRNMPPWKSARIENWTPVRYWYRGRLFIISTNGVARPEVRR